jgi:hypothetical protein
MPDYGGGVLWPTPEVVERRRALRRAWIAAGKVGPDPVAREASFRRGEDMPFEYLPITVRAPGAPQRRLGGR